MDDVIGELDNASWKLDALCTQLPGGPKKNVLNFKAVLLLNCITEKAHVLVV